MKPRYQNRTSLDSLEKASALNLTLLNIKNLINSKKEWNYLQSQQQTVLKGLWWKFSSNSLQK